jgi:hypothetical protein
MKTNLASTLPSAASANDIRDIKPPMEIPNEWLWLWIALAVVVLVAAGVALWLILRKRQALTIVVPPVPAHIRAKQKLAEALLFISDPNRFCTEVSNTLRYYLEERFRLRAPERTTEEFLIELQDSRNLTPDQKQSLREFLQSCDLVKFARFEPTETALRQLHDAALRLVDETQFDPIGAEITSPPLPPSATAVPEIANHKT